MRTTSLLVLQTFLSTASALSCSIPRLQQTEEKVRNCSSLAEDVEDPCDWLERVVGECGDLWRPCHSAGEMRRMRGRQIEAILRLENNQTKYDNCRHVREFRSQGRLMQEELHRERCSESKIFQSQSEFQNCSHEAVTLVYRQLHQQAGQATSKKLCKTLAIIANLCPRHLRTCFETYDLLQMRSIHVNQMIKFLKRIFSKRFSDMDFLDSCNLDKEENEDEMPITESSNTEDWREDVYNSITENIIQDLNDNHLSSSSVLDDPSLTEEIDRNTPTRDEEEPLRQKVILDYELNGNQDDTEPSEVFEDDNDLNHSKPELDKNNCYRCRPSYVLIILIFLITRHYAF